jgi:hypothetical protein
MGDPSGNFESWFWGLCDFKFGLFGILVGNSTILPRKTT